MNADDRKLMQAILEAMEHLHRTGDTQVFDLYAAPEIIPALRERLAHCDRCGKRLGGEGDIHTCTPKTNQCGETCERAKMCATCAGVLAQPEQPAQQEPVLETVYETIIQWDEGGGKRSRRELARRIVALYTATPQRRPLSDEQMWELWNLQGDDAMEQQEAIAFARAIEAAHGIKE